MVIIFDNLYSWSNFSKGARLIKMLGLEIMSISVSHCEWEDATQPSKDQEPLQRFLHIGLLLCLSTWLIATQRPPSKISSTAECCSSQHNWSSWLNTARYRGQQPPYRNPALLTHNGVRIPAHPPCGCWLPQHGAEGTSKAATGMSEPQHRIGIASLSHY